MLRVIGFMFDMLQLEIVGNPRFLWIPGCSSLDAGCVATTEDSSLPSIREDGVEVFLSSAWNASCENFFFGGGKVK